MIAPAQNLRKFCRYGAIRLGRAQQAFMGQLSPRSGFSAHQITPKRDENAITPRRNGFPPPPLTSNPIGYPPFGDR